MSEKHQSCPKCNKESIAEILWGYYEVTDEMNEALEKKRDHSWRMFDYRS